MLHLLKLCLLSFTFFTVLAPNPVVAAFFTFQEALDSADEFALDPMFQAGGYIEIFDGNGGSSLGGSGVLIHPEWVVTAGHVLLDGGTTRFPQVGFSTNNNFFETPTNVVMAQDFFEFPGYNDDITSGGGVDLGLIHLSQPIFDVVPAVIGTSVIGDHIYTSGFGRPGVQFSELPADGIMRAGENEIDDYGWQLAGSTDYYLTDYETGGFGISPLPREWQASPGDSGGGWYNDAGELIAVGAFGRGATVSGGIRLDLFEDWIYSHVPVPEPGTGILTGLGLAALSRHRRNRDGG